MCKCIYICIGSKQKMTTMEEIETYTYDFDGDTYEIKLFRTGNGFKVISYKDGQRVNPYTYCVNDINAYDYRIYMGENAHEKLIQVAKDDIADGLVYGKKLTQTN